MLDEYQTQLIDCLMKTDMSESNYNGDCTIIDIEYLVKYVLSKRKNHNTFFFVGNGGSAAIASHMTADYMKNGRMRCCSMYDDPVITCLSNDYGYDQVFSKQLEMMAQEGDVLCVISSSGESENIVQSVKTAHKLGMDILSFTGFKEDNSVRMQSDISVYVPSSEYGIVESVHTIILQQVVDMIMKEDDC